MKKIVISIALLLSSLTASAQIGVLTLGKRDRIQIGMWYTIHQRNRDNNMYITYDDEDMAVYKLEQLLSQFDAMVEIPDGTDEHGSPYWTVMQDNGYVSDIYYTKELYYELYTITVVSAKSE